jgi:hypothetical protein
MACQPDHPSPTEIRARDDAKILIKNNGPGACLPNCAGTVHTPVDRDLQTYARQTACRVGISQDLLLALIIKEYLDPVRLNAYRRLAKSDVPNKSVGITSIQYTTAKEIISRHHLEAEVPEVNNHDAMVDRLSDDPKLAIELAAYLLADGKREGLTDKGSFVVAYETDFKDWHDPRLHDAGEDTAKYPDQTTGGLKGRLLSQSLRQRAIDYDHIVRVLKVADDWNDLPPDVRQKAAPEQGTIGDPGAPMPELKPSLPYDVPPKPCC